MWLVEVMERGGEMENVIHTIPLLQRAWVSPDGEIENRPSAASVMELWCHGRCGLGARACGGKDGEIGGSTVEEEVNLPADGQWVRFSISVGHVVFPLRRIRSGVLLVCVIGWKEEELVGRGLFSVLSLQHAAMQAVSTSPSFIPPPSSKRRRGEPGVAVDVSTESDILRAGEEEGPGGMWYIPHSEKQRRVEAIAERVGSSGADVVRRAVVEVSKRACLHLLPIPSHKHARASPWPAAVAAFRKAQASLKSLTQLGGGGGGELVRLGGGGEEDSDGGWGEEEGEVEGDGEGGDERWERGSGVKVVDDFLMIADMYGVEGEAVSKFRRDAALAAARFVARLGPVPLTLRMVNVLEENGLLGKKTAERLRVAAAGKRIPRAIEGGRNEELIRRVRLAKIWGIGVNGARILEQTGVESPEQVPHHHDAWAALPSRASRICALHFTQLQQRLPREEALDLAALVSLVASRLCAGTTVDLAGSISRGALHAKDLDLIITHPYGPCVTLPAIALLLKHMNALPIDLANGVSSGPLASSTSSTSSPPHPPSSSSSSSPPSSPPSSSSSSIPTSPSHDLLHFQPGGGDEEVTTEAWAQMIGVRDVTMHEEDVEGRRRKEEEGGARTGGVEGGGEGEGVGEGERERGWEEGDGREGGGGVVGKRVLPSAEVGEGLRERQAVGRLSDRTRESIAVAGVGRSGGWFGKEGYHHPITYLGVATRPPWLRGLAERIRNAGSVEAFLEANGAPPLLTATGIPRTTLTEASPSTKPPSSSLTTTSKSTSSSLSPARLPQWAQPSLPSQSPPDAAVRALLEAENRLAWHGLYGEDGEDAPTEAPAPLKAMRVGDIARRIDIKAYHRSNRGCALVYFGAGVMLNRALRYYALCLGLGLNDCTLSPKLRSGSEVLLDAKPLRPAFETPEQVFAALGIRYPSTGPALDRSLTDVHMAALVANGLLRPDAVLK